MNQALVFWIIDYVNVICIMIKLYDKTFLKCMNAIMYQNYSTIIIMSLILVI